MGTNNLERKIGRLDITYPNLLALIKTEGYWMKDKIYYVKEEGRGLAGTALIDCMSNVK